MNLSPEEIEELLKLKHIWNELEEDKPVNPNLIAKELENVMDDIKRSAEHSRLDKEAQEGDSFDRKMHDADNLRDALLHIDVTKNDIDVDERKKLERSVRDVMADLAHDKKINPETVTEQQLKDKHLSPEEIDEILKLKHIYVE